MGKLGLKDLKKNKILLIGLATAVLLGLFFLLKPGSEPESTNQQQTQTAQQATEKTFTLEVNDGKLVDGSDTLKASQGDDIVIKVTSNQADELHLHGYDKEAELKPGVPSQLSFKADKSGRFIIELHKSDQEIAALEVQPQL